MRLDSVRELLDALAASVETLGPILDLDRGWRSNPATVGHERLSRENAKMNLQFFDGIPSVRL